MNRRQRFAILGGMALTFWFGFVSDSEEYGRHLSATLILTALGVLLLHSSRGTSGELRSGTTELYSSRSVRRGIVALLAILVSAVGSWMWLDQRPSPSSVSIPAPPPAELFDPRIQVPEFRDAEHRFAAGETVAEVLEANGVSATNAAAWIKAASRVYALSQIRDGQKLQMRVDLGASDLVSLKMDIDVATYLVAHRRDGQIVASRESLAFGRVRRIVEGTIDSSFYATAARADVPDEIIAEVAEVLIWDLDFEKLKPGAKFQIQFEELRNPDGAGTIPGQLQSARIVELGGKVHEGIWFKQPGENTGSYYTSKGVALGRYYSRFPCSFTRILDSGKDGAKFEAPLGTPVRSVGDGTIDKSLYRPGNGHYVAVRHDEAFVSGYDNLSRVAVSLRAGTTVRKGDIIGYVGAPYLTTTPQLHFTMLKNGAFIDPLSSAAPRAKVLSGVLATEFKKIVEKVNDAYAAAERAGGNLVLMASGNGPTSSPSSSPPESQKESATDPAPALTFHGYRCTEDCSGHEAGYEWAEENEIEDPDDCDGDSNSFVEGCRAYADEQVSPSTTHED